MKNPYRIEDGGAESMNDLFGNFRIVPTKKKMTERGELLKYFGNRLGKPIGFVAMKVTKLQLQDLYFLKSICDQDEGRPYKDKEGKEQYLAWGQIFYTNLKPKQPASFQ